MRIKTTIEPDKIFMSDAEEEKPLAHLQQNTGGRDSSNNRVASLGV